MRYLLRNCIRDRALDKRRSAHPGKVAMRPIIGGKPLPPAAIRVLMLSEINRSMLDEIEFHQGVGNVQLLQAGRGGGETDILALRKSLGWAIIPVPEEPTPAFPLSVVAVLPEPVSTPEPEPVRGQMQDLIVKDEVATFMATEIPAMVEPPVRLAPIESPVEEEESVEESSSTDEVQDDLVGKSNGALRAVLSSLGGSGTGKKKSDLLAEIRAARALL